MILVSLLFGACSENDIDGVTDEPVTPPEQEANFFMSAAPGAISRTELDDESHIVWKAGDKLSVWEENNALNANVPLTLTAATAGERVGKFEGTLTPATDEFTLYAIYPYADNYGDDITAVPVTIPTVVNQAEDINDLVGVSDFMLGKATLSAADEEYLMGFVHPLTFIDVVIDGSNCVFSDATIESLTITANKAFVGDYACDLTTRTLTSTAVEDAGKTLVINYADGAAMSNVQHAWIAINPVDLTDGDCRFVLKMTNGQQLTISVNPNVAFEAQKKYTMTFADLDKGIEVGKAEPAYFDLVAASGRANCYIITNGGYYKFDGTYPDNGKTYTINNASADWIWATGSESKVSEVTYSAKTKNIYFKVEPASNGNTIIAGFDESGAIVWSWHIWVTVEDPRLDPTHYTRGETWQLMDRNLGSFSNDEGDLDSYGLLYQWGRKDPFPGVNTKGSLTSGKESGAFGSWTQAYVINPTYADKIKFSSTRNSNTASKGDVAYTIAYPTTFIHAYNAAGTTAKGQTWLYTTPAEDAAKLWNSTTTRSKKTIYDPCPAGYCIPVGDQYSWRGTYFTNYASWESDTSVSGMIYKNGESNKTYLPAAGYRASGVLNNVGYGGYYWNANVKYDDANFRAYALTGSNRTTIKTSDIFRTEFGCSVRCMKM